MVEGSAVGLIGHAGVLQRHAKHAWIRLERRVEPRDLRLTFSVIVGVQQCDHLIEPLAVHPFQCHRVYATSDVATRECVVVDAGYESQRQDRQDWGCPPSLQSRSAYDPPSNE